MQRRRPFLCICLTGLLVGQLAGCYTWRVQNIPPGLFTVPNPTKPVRIVRRDGSVVTLHGTRISGDTLYGTSGPSGTSLSGPPLAIPLGDVRTIEVRHVDALKTVGLGLGIGAAVFGILAVWYIAACDGCQA